MIDRLISSLRTLSAPAEGLIAGDRDLMMRMDAAAKDFADAFLLVSDCPQLRLTSLQRELLESLDSQLHRIILDTAASQTESSLHHHPEWNGVRQSAKEALHLLGYGGQ